MSNQQRAWQRMLSGRRLDLVNPDPKDIEIEDIAHGLCRVARWNGQTTGDHAFSVAQHSLLVEVIFKAQNDNATKEERLAALLHDAPEYVIGDMISPFKAVLGQDYTLFEDKLQQSIHKRFGLPEVLPPSLKTKIKDADKVSAWLEATQLAGFSEEEALDIFGPKPEGFIALNCTPQSTENVKSAFIRRFHEFV